MAAKISDKHAIFCREYLRDFNRTRAYKVAYPTIKNNASARACAGKLLSKPTIRNEIDRLKEERFSEADLTVERILLEYARLAFFNPRDFLKEDGSPIPFDELTDEQLTAIAGIKVRTEPGKDGGEIVEYKLADRQKALDSLGKFKGMFIDRRMDIKPPEKPNRIQKVNSEGETTGELGD